MLTRCLLGLLRLYQWAVSPLLGDCCRYEPSCSRYATLCLRYHGGWWGTWLTLKRLARCNPFFTGGIDLPPLPEHADPQDRQIDYSRFARHIDAQLYSRQAQTSCSCRQTTAPHRAASSAPSSPAAAWPLGKARSEAQSIEAKPL